MKKLKQLLILLALTATSASGLAEQNNTQEGSRHPIVLQRSHEEGYKKVPKTPDRQVITCSYDGEGLTILFTLSEGNGLLTISNPFIDPIVYNLDTSDNESYILIGSFFEPIYIQLTTEKGNTYLGVIE